MNLGGILPPGTLHRYPEKARPPMRPSLRFEVFHRDGFTCCYCGKTPPEAVLEVDHLVPRAEGGSDDIDNLGTACFDCNRGKGSRMLDERPRARQTPSQEEMAERVDQARAFAEYQQDMEQITGEQIDSIYWLWCVEFGGREEEGVFYCKGGFPAEATLRNAMKQLPFTEILQAVRIAANKFGGTPRTMDTIKYFWGIVWNMVKQRAQA